jgi:hypothetical protein
MEDASLDDFLDGDESDEAEQSAGADDHRGSGEQQAAGNTEAAGEPVAVDPDGVDPATTTYAWSEDGVACETCGTVVARRWDDDGQLVCPDCKEW